MMSKEAMKLAKAWFERNTYGDEAVDVYEALCAALAEQPAQHEPVAWYVERQHVGFRDHGLKCGPFWKLSEAEEWTDSCHILKGLYATPPAQRKPLTEEEMEKIAAEYWLYPRKFVRAIEAAHGIKENT